MNKRPSVSSVKYELCCVGFHALSATKVLHYPTPHHWDDDIKTGAGKPQNGQKLKCSAIESDNVKVALYSTIGTNVIYLDQKLPNCKAHVLTLLDLQRDADGGYKMQRLSQMTGWL